MSYDGNVVRPEHRLKYKQVLKTGAPMVVPVLDRDVSRRGLLGRALGVPVLLSALANPGGAENIPRKAHRAAVLSLAVSPDGRSLISGSALDERDSAFKIWRLGGSYSDLERDEQLRDSVPSLAFSPDQKLALALGSGSAVVRRPPWIEAGTSLNGPGLNICRALTYSPDGRFLLCAGGDGVLSVWQPSRSTPERYYSLGFGSLVSVLFSSSGHLMAAASASMAKLFSFSGGRLKAVAEVAATRDGGDIRALAFVGKTIVSIGYSGPYIRLVQTEGFAPVGVLGKQTRGNNRLIPLPSDRLVTAGDDGVVRIWDTRKMTLVRAARGHSREICSSALSPDSQKLFTGDREGNIVEWSLPMLRVSGHFSDPRLAPPPVISRAQPSGRHHSPANQPSGTGLPSTTTYGATIHQPCTAQPVPAGYVCQCNCVPY